MKALGYFLKTLSILIIIILISSTLKTIAQTNDYVNEGTAYTIGYISGTLFIMFLLGWLTLKLLKYSNLLINSKK